MNMRKIIFTLLFISIPLSAMKVEPGTVIDPLYHNGQFTVSLADSAFTSLPSAMPALTSQTSKAASDIFKNKGVPVVISTVAGTVPWWALTTGTGYLLISQCDISDPSILASIASGISYVAGQQSNSLLKKYINNPYAKNFAKIALCASCLGISYISGNPIISDALFATANAIGLQTLIDNCSELLMQPKTITSPQQPQTQTNTWYTLSPALKANLIDGTADALTIMLPALCTTNACDPNVMLRILLYEQAYRLAQCGCVAAQRFINK